MKKKGMTQERGMVESGNPKDIQPISARAPTSYGRRIKMTTQTNQHETQTNSTEITKEIEISKRQSQVTPVTTVTPVPPYGIG